MKLAIAGVLFAAAGVASADPRVEGKPPIQPAQPAQEKARLEIQPPGKALTRLAIDNPLGSIRVEGYDGASLQIETRKTAPDDDSLDRLRISLVPNADGSVRIATAADPAGASRPLARKDVRIDILVRAPRAVHIEAAVDNGVLEISNMDAGGDLDSASGAISVRNVQGELLTHSMTGATSLAQVFGSVDAQTLMADVDLDSISGEKLFASANHGAIAGRRVRSRDIELSTTEGRIVLEAEAALQGRIVVSSLKGDIDVKLRRKGAMVVRAKGAKIVQTAVPAILPSADGWVQTSLGSGAHPALVELRSRFGSVQFTIATVE